MIPCVLRKRLAENLRTERKRKLYSQTKLAEQAGLSLQMIADIETCRRWPSDKTLIKIADALDSDVCLLLKPLDHTVVCAHNPKLLRFMLRKLQEAVNGVLENLMNR